MSLIWEEVDIFIFGMNEDNIPGVRTAIEISICRNIRKLPAVKIIVHSPSIDSTTIFQMLRVGADALSASMRDTRIYSRQFWQSK